jgi:hypothetical protein
MIKELPVFKGYTVDIRLKQFRKVEKGEIEFIDFKSLQGDDLLGEFIETIDENTPEGKEMLASLW